MPKLSHVHRYSPGGDLGDNVSRPPLVLLHGSDGRETDLIPWAGELAPHVATLAVRGTVETEGGHAFVRRLPDRRLDEPDLVVRAAGLAEFIQAARAAYELGRPVAIGYSNGAIMSAALLLMYPGLLAGAILLRPLSPFTTELPCRLDGTPVLIIDGASDGRRSPHDGRLLAERLAGAGAAVTHRVLPVGHAITSDDGIIAQDWLHAW